MTRSYQGRVFARLVRFPHSDLSWNKPAKTQTKKFGKKISEILPPPITTFKPANEKTNSFGRQAGRQAGRQVGRENYS